MASHKWDWAPCIQIDLKECPYCLWPLKIEKYYVSVIYLKNWVSELWISFKENGMAMWSIWFIEAKQSSLKQHLNIKMIHFVKIAKTICSSIENTVLGLRLNYGKLLSQIFSTLIFSIFFHPKSWMNRLRCRYAKFMWSNWIKAKGNVNQGYRTTCWLLALQSCW